MQTYGLVEVQPHAFLTSALHECEWSASYPPLYPRRESPRFPLDTRLFGPQNRSVRGDEEKKSLSLPGIELRFCLPNFLLAWSGSYETA